MKKLSIILSLFALGFTSAQSFKYGVTANFHKGSTVNIHDRSKGNFGGGIGAFADFSLVENDIYDSAWLYFSPQLEFSMEGERGQAWNNADVAVQKYNNYYIAMPLYIKYFFKNHGYKSDIYVMVGPKLEFLASNKVDEKEAIEYANARGYTNNPTAIAMGAKSLSSIGLDNKIAKFGYGVSLVAGVKIDEKWNVFIRFDRGLSKVYPDYTKYNTYNRMLGIGINYYIGESNY
ncbi:outer membrane beta-barrel protein [Epilithonimonas xixisoli]|uniref:Outer membrane protein with beta-barrel domain n=1 Tax=Epilithonimonas xixisoli TaxID=1476462 RepID=A0A4R8I5D0_9FLAO|nr:outer membrane beta-barrel protein [Epilithonimonas xixisoli]TDX84107.1 outer membrane protein with beta-barrel domain [Epilithonimonas xixisoli]